MTFIEPKSCNVVGGGAGLVPEPRRIDLVLIDFPMPTCPVAVQPPAS